MATEPQYVRPQLHQGMDHGHYDYRPLNSSRQPLRWPDDCRVALCVVVSLDIMEWTAPSDGYQLPSLAGGYGPSPHPDVTRWSHREYGHRVGVFRLLDTLERHGIKATVAMDVLTAENYPFLVRHIQSRGVRNHRPRHLSQPHDYQPDVGGGRAGVYRLVPRAAGPGDRLAVTGLAGARVRRVGADAATLAQAGIDYVCDWVNDDQPYVMNAGEGAMCAFPMTLPLTMWRPYGTDGYP